MKNKRQVFINIFSNAFAMLVSTGINFFLTPYITRTVGVAAYGFVPLASNFVSYVTIVTTAFNSMGSRFITVELQQDNRKRANGYFSTIFFMNIGLAAFSGIVFTIIISCLTKIIEIPKELTSDIVILFALSFLSAIFSLAMNVFSSATFCKNRLDLKSIVSIITTIVRAFLLVVLFMLFPAKVYYIGLANISVSIIEGISNFFIQKKIMGELKVLRSDFHKKYIKTLFTSGVWNSVSQLSSILMTGLDLLVANIFISASDSGILSIAKIMPNLLYTCVALIVTNFGPQFVLAYADRKNGNNLLDTMDFSAKLISFITVIPVAGFIGFGKEFFQLWVPEQNASLLFILAILTLLGDAVSYPIKAFDNIFSAVNKLRWPAIATLVCGLLNVLIMIPLLKYTELGLYAIAGTSAILLASKDLLFKIPYIAKIVKINPVYLWKYVFKYIFCAAIIIGLSIIIKQLIPANGWITLISDAIIVGMIGCLINYAILFNSNEKRKVQLMIKEKIKGKKS